MDGIRPGHFSDGGRGEDQSYPIDPSRLLRARRERPGNRYAAKQRDELASLHSITSSASSWIELGTSMPSARAVCKLITNWNFVDCKTGRSAGFAPLRT